MSGAAAGGARERGARADRHAALFAFFRRVHGGDPALAALEARVLARHARDRAAFSDVLEPSLSWRPGALSLYRFSYAFPGFRADPAGVARGMLDFCAPLGETYLDPARRLLRAARHPRARQPLFGFALDPGAARRVKLYLQFDDADDPEPFALAERLLGCRLQGRLPAGAPLHLLGLDLGPGGLTGAKLYLLHRRLDAAELAARLGPVPLVEALRAAGHGALHDVLAIHRMEGPDDPALARPAEIDFALAQNGLAWPAVRALLPAPFETSPLSALEREFSIRVRRISVPIGRDDKLNVYYVLDPVLERAKERP